MAEWRDNGEILHFRTVLSPLHYAIIVHHDGYGVSVIFAPDGSIHFF